MDLKTTITFPKLGELLVANASRTHNRITKQATREELVEHHQRRIPGHFTRAAHGRYGYKPRQPRYIFLKAKRFGNQLDLVQTGKSKARIKGHGDVSVGGSGDAVRGKLHMRFDFDARVAEQQTRARKNRRYQPFRQRKQPNVTIADMKSEVARMTPGEVHEIALGTRRRYVHLVRTTAGARQQITV